MLPVPIPPHLMIASTTPATPPSLLGDVRDQARAQVGARLSSAHARARGPMRRAYVVSDLRRLAPFPKVQPLPG
jgi:hypothetical protein